MEVTHLAPDIELPPDWYQPRVIDIAARRANATVGGPFGSDLVAKDYVDSGVPVIRGQNMGQRYVAGEFAFVSPAKAKSLQANLARPSDLVFTQRGTLGQVALVPTDPYEKYLISQSQMKLTLDCGAAAPGYVHQYFASALGQKQILDSAIQTGVPHTNLGILRNYAVPMPRRVDEQETIATALTDVDALINSLEQLLTKKRQIKQGAMQELLTGQRRLPGFSDGWKRLALRNAAEVDTGINKPTDSMGSGALYVTVQDLYHGTSIRGELLGRIQLSEAEIQAYALRPGDIVFGKSSVKRDGIAYPSLFLGFDEVVTFSGFTYRARALQDFADSTFLFYWLRSSRIRKWLVDNSQSSALTNINKRIVDSIPVLLPALNEQREIAAVLSDMDTELTALESRLTKARDLKQAMAQALLTGRIRLVEGSTP